MYAETEFTLDEASKYDKNDDEIPDDSGDGDDGTDGTTMLPDFQEDFHRSDNILYRKVFCLENQQWYHSHETPANFISSWIILLSRLQEPVRKKIPMFFL